MVNKFLFSEEYSHDMFQTLTFLNTNDSTISRECKKNCMKLVYWLGLYRLVPNMWHSSPDSPWYSVFLLVVILDHVINALKSQKSHNYKVTLFIHVSNTNISVIKQLQNTADLQHLISLPWFLYGLW